MNSAQLGESAMVLVICAFSALRVGFEDVSIRITSCRLEGGMVNRTGIVDEEDIVEGYRGVRRVDWRVRLERCRKGVVW
jgi:hypothetical protein